jgi:hypothetical protein
MTTTTATRPHEVPLPAGAEFADRWQGDGDMPYRVIGSDERRVTDDLCVYVSAVQFADGSIDAGRIEALGVFVNSDPVPVERVHAMISALQEAVAQVERWAQR